jgi:putative chromate ion transporter
MSAYKLTIKSISKFELPAMKAKWLLWLFYIAGIVITVITEREEILLFLACGFLYMAIKAPPQWLKKPSVLPAGILISTEFWKYDGKTLQEIGWFFAKAGAFVFGSGLAIVPFLHGGVVKEFDWLNEHQFVDAVAVAMITPGPVVITVGFIGYLVAGFPGACVAALATFLPCYVFTVALAPSFKKIANKHRGICRWYHRCCNRRTGWFRDHHWITVCDRHPHLSDRYRHCISTDLHQKVSRTLHYRDRCNHRFPDQNPLICLNTLPLLFYYYSFSR